MPSPLHYFNIITLMLLAEELKLSKFSLWKFFGFLFIARTIPRW